MKTYIVKQREILITTYRVAADDEEDAFEAIQSGLGVQLGQEVECMPDDEDEWEAEEE